MNKISQAFFSLSLLTAFCASAYAASPAEIIVQQQLAAYNARDIDAFMATYSDDIELTDLRHSWKHVGKTEMRPDYEQLFKDTTLHCIVTDHINLGDTIIDHERVLVNIKGAPAVAEAVAIYEIKDGKIAKVTFIDGKITPGGKL